MLRSFFLAVGISLCILGAEALVVEKAVLAETITETKPTVFGPQVTQKNREVMPPEWARWGLLSGGAVVILYSITIPRRNA